MSEVEVIDNSSYTWSPNKGKQEEFCKLPDDIKEAFYGGAMGGGKTNALIMYPILREWYKHPRFRGIIFRRTYPQVGKYLVPEGDRFYKPLGASYNNTEHVYKFPSGARIWFGYLDKDADVHNYDGTEFNYIAFDELTSFTEYMYIYITSTRLRSPAKGLPAVTRNTGMPGGIGHSWVRKRFVEPAKEGLKKIFDTKTGSYRIFIPARMQDNPKLLENTPDYINSVMALPEAERKALMDGDWWSFAGQVFTEFRSIKYPFEPENALHVVKPFQIESWYPKIISCDWGMRHKTAIYATAVLPDGRCATYYEQIAQGQKISVWGANLSQFLRTQDNIVLAVLDRSAWKDEGHPKTLEEQIREATDTIWTPSNSDRIAGKLNMHDFFRWEKRPPKYIPAGGFNIDTANRIFRLYGSERYEEYCKSFEPEKPETNVPKALIFDTCKELINVIPMCVYDDKKVEDVAKFEGDDAYDSYRYNLMAVDLYAQECKEEFGRVQQRGDIVREFERTGDYNAFHQRMDHLERNAEANVVSINRFREARRLHRAS